MVYATFKTCSLHWPCSLSFEYLHATTMNEANGLIY